MIRLDTLDRYCATKGIEQIDYLKLDVEGHDVRCVKLLQALEILGSESFDYLVYLLPNLGFVYLALRRHRYPSLPFGWNLGFSLARRHSSGLEQQPNAQSR